MKKAGPNWLSGGTWGRQRRAKRGRVTGEDVVAYLRAHWGFQNRPAHWAAPLSYEDVCLIRAAVLGGTEFGEPTAPTHDPNHVYRSLTGASGAFDVRALVAELRRTEA
jgi:hypothetical protein